MKKHPEVIPPPQVNHTFMQEEPQEEETFPKEHLQRWTNPNPARVKAGVK